MRVNRSDLVVILESMMPGIGSGKTKDGGEQSTFFVFKGDRVHTFNDQIYCWRQVPFELNEVAVKAKPLLELLNKLKEIEVDIGVSENGFGVRTPNKKASIRMESEFGLPIEIVDTPEEWVVLPDGFSEVVSIVASCASADGEADFAFRCVHFSDSHMEATDRYQLVRHKISCGMGDVLVMADTIKKIASFGVNEASRTDNWLHFRNQAGLNLSCRVYPDEFPDIGQYMDVKGREIHLPHGIEDVLSKASIFSEENADGSVVIVTLKPNVMTIKGSGVLGWYMERVEVEYDGEETSFGVAPKLLLELSKKGRKCVFGGGMLAMEYDDLKFAVSLRKAETSNS